MAKQLRLFEKLESLGLRISGLFKCSLEPVVEVLRSVSELSTLTQLSLNLSEYQ